MATSVNNILVEAAVDDNLISDSVFNNLLAVQGSYFTTAKYCKDGSTDITERMRSLIIEWIYGLCFSEGQQYVVPTAAINYFDRFLNVSPIRPDELQLLAAACILVSSKFFEVEFIFPESLCHYSDNAFDKESLLEYEIKVLTTLEWRTMAITPHDFVGILVKRIGIADEEQAKICRTVAHEFIIETVQSGKLDDCIQSDIAGVAVVRACKLVTSVDYLELVVTILDSALVRVLHARCTDSPVFIV